MAAPQNGPELSVVKTQSEGPQVASNDAAPSRPTRTDAEVDSSRREGRRGLPWWALLLSVAVGAALFFNQYERAERSKAEALALRGELAEVGQKLAAYESRLSALRSGIDDLIERAGALGTLAHADPMLSPALASDAPLPAVTSAPLSAVTSAPLSAATLETPADTLPARLPSAVRDSSGGDAPQALPVPERLGSEVRADRSEVVDSALSVTGLDAFREPNAEPTTSVAGAHLR